LRVLHAIPTYTDQARYFFLRFNAEAWPFRLIAPLLGELGSVPRSAECHWRASCKIHRTMWFGWLLGKGEPLKMVDFVRAVSKW